MIWYVFVKINNEYFISFEKFSIFLFFFYWTSLDFVVCRMVCSSVFIVSRVCIVFRGIGFLFFFWSCIVLSFSFWMMINLLGVWYMLEAVIIWLVWSFDFFRVDLFIYWISFFWVCESFFMVCFILSIICVVLFMLIVFVVIRFFDALGVELMKFVVTKFFLSLFVIWMFVFVVWIFVFVVGSEIMILLGIWRVLVFVWVIVKFFIILVLFCIIIEGVIVIVFLVLLFIWLTVVVGVELIGVL